MSQETESLLKKVDYDPYTEDEVSEASPTPLWCLRKLNRCWRRWIVYAEDEVSEVSDPSLVSQELESLLKKVDCDPYAEDEVNEVERKKKIPTVTILSFRRDKSKQTV